MKPAPDNYEQYVNLLREKWQGSPFGRFMNWHIEEMGADKVRMRLAWQEKFEGWDGTAHPGTAASLIDSAASASVFSRPEKVTSPHGATVSLYAAFHGEVPRGSDLVAIARLRSRGEAVQMIEVDVEDSEGRLVASGNVTYKLGATLGQSWGPRRSR